MQVLRNSVDVMEEYLAVMRREINPSTEYERVNRSILSKIDVITATSDDIAKFLDSLTTSQMDWNLQPLCRNY